ncbi:ABC transporter substrate-binding protein [Lacrimispora sp. 210928-DFI.3.58]|uniref:ABC transporter substrate-binding protein n=1 Tax=Lacrimispora sp. 210928-DFI.3.58 TaxID=2883214 RepID=UPI0015B5D5C5|nr:ABC transporter substrate-binding protein [Lacrimispora sp. 210928-DFI.3.58]MCB7319012.1 ABC transporter substrate-binding protein [Lacrimispora sp. 210928-DFI.3.58]
MKLKKLTSMLCAAVLAMSALAGCSSSSSTSATTAAAATTAAVTEAAEKATEAAAEAGEAAAELTGEPIKIGTIYAMSGGSAAIGTNILRGIDFAVAEINAAGGVNGRPLEVVRGDHAGDAATGRSEAERLITQEKVDVMMGCHMSVVTEVVAQVCQQYGVPMITAISTLDRLSNEEHKDMDYFFRLCPLNSVYVEDMLKYLKDSTEQTGEEVKTVAIFTDRAAIGQELIRCVELFKDQYGIELVATVDYTSNATDLSAQVLALKQADPDAILCDSYIGDATLFIQTLKEQNYSPKMIVAKANGFTDPSFITNLGAISNGVASVVEFNPDLVNGVEINEEFKAEFGVDMNGHSAESYTVVWLFKTAIEAAGSTDGAAVKDALASLEINGEFPGGRKIILPYDKIKFENYDLAGEAHYRDNTSASVAIAQIQDGAWKTVWPFNFTDTKIVYPAPLQ